MTAEVHIRRADITSAVAQSLIGELNAELSGLYPEPGATHFRLDPSEVDESHGAFLIAYHAGEPVGCGAIRRLDDETAEIKRMYVRRDARGRGLGRHLVAALEAEARRLQVKRLVLETGVRQRNALALYERLGFTHIPPYGEYTDSPLTVCLGKSL